MDKLVQRKALVTGATGFVGSHLAGRLVADGWEVHLLTRPTSDLTPLRPILSRVRLHCHDGTMQGMQAILQDARPTVVFHLASQFVWDHLADDVVPLLQNNLLFGTQLVEAMARHGAHRLVNTGTWAQHYENKDYSPACLYAAIKQAFEALLQWYVENTPLRAITLKLYDTYGPDDPRPKLFAALRQAALERRPLAMSPGEQVLDLVYIDDVIDAYLIAGRRLEKDQLAGQESYAVTTGEPLTLRQVVAQVEEATGMHFAIQWEARPYRPREMMVHWDRGKTLPGWQPRVGLAEGIRRTWAGVSAQQRHEPGDNLPARG